MAINYLNSIDLNQNELIKGRIENQPNNAAAGTGVEGQLYYDTHYSVLKVWSGGSWSGIGGGVETLTTTDGTYIDLTPNSATAGAVTVTADLSATDGTAVAATRFLSKDNTWDVPVADNYGYWVLDADGNGATANIGPGDTADFVGGLKIGTDSTSGGILNITHDLQAQTDSTSAASPAAGATFTVVDSVTRDTTGHATGLNVKTITLPAALTVGDGQIDGRTSGLGLSGSMDATANQSGNTTFTVTSNATTTATANTLMYRDGSGYGYVETPASGDSTTKIATTAFVQSSLTGLLEFKSGFNASTGAIVSGGNLTSGATRVAVAVGDYYVVTVAGDFFGNASTPLTPGDSVIVQTAALAGASVEADFIVVQSDTDLATLTTVGIGNVNAGGAIDVAYSSGTATVSVEDSTASNKGAVIVAGSSGISVTYASGTATVANTQTNSDNTYAETIASTNLTIDHGLNTSDVIVQLYDITTGETVFADVDRISATRIGVTFASTPTNSVRVLVQKIG